MWLSEKVKFGGESNALLAETGEVSINGTSLAVMTQNEMRRLSMAFPGGFRWRPRVGQRVLVLKTGDGESVVIGAVADSAAGADGDMLIEGERCAVSLKNDGSVIISGDSICLDGEVDIVGSLTVNGEEIRPDEGSGVL